MENLQFEHDGQFITFSDHNREDEMQICISYNGGYVSHYLSVEQVTALKDYLIKQLNNLPNEPKRVRNNEDKKKVCFICKGKGVYIYEHEVYECGYCK